MLQDDHHDLQRQNDNGPDYGRGELTACAFLLYTVLLSLHSVLVAPRVDSISQKACSNTLQTSVKVYSTAHGPTTTTAIPLPPPPPLMSHPPPPRKQPPPRQLPPGPQSLPPHGLLIPPPRLTRQRARALTSGSSPPHPPHPPPRRKRPRLPYGLLRPPLSGLPRAAAAALLTRPHRLRPPLPRSSPLPFPRRSIIPVGLPAGWLSQLVQYQPRRRLTQRPSML